MAKVNFLNQGHLCPNISQLCGNAHEKTIK